jgi:hypothetical protein
MSDRQRQDEQPSKREHVLGKETQLEWSVAQWYKVQGNDDDVVRCWYSPQQEELVAAEEEREQVDRNTVAT